MTTNICFIDTETTSLGANRRAWDIAAIRREDGHQEERVWFVDATDLDLGNADRKSLEIGRYYTRHPDATDNFDFTAGYPGPELYGSEAWVMRDIEKWTRGAHLVGAVVSFDADVLAARMRANGVLPSWHYHLIDVESMALGWLNGIRAAGVFDQPIPRDKPVTTAPGEYLRDLAWRTAAADLALPPWKSDELAAACGVEPPTDEERHTALGDARWAMRWYDTLTGGAA